MIRRIAIHLLLAAVASATPGRYALVVGTNDPHAADLAPLRFAERDARRFGDTLAQCCGFEAPARARRTIVLLRPTRAQLGNAVRALAAQVQADRQAFGSGFSATFLLYNAGHGRDGELLVADGPITGQALGDLFREVDATINLGVFDACNSASLDTNLASRGIIPGRNVLDRLPETLRESNGAIWLASSRQGQFSFEDPKLEAGVFTHFLRAALETPDTPGEDLNRVFKRAQAATAEHVRRAGREQHPQVVLTLKGGGVPEFSFVGAPRSTLVLSAGVQGPLLLDYAPEHPFPPVVIEKASGRPLELPVYAGNAMLVTAGGASAIPDRGTYAAAGYMELVEGESVDVRTEGEFDGSDYRLVSKGAGATRLYAVRTGDTCSLHLRTGYRYAGSVGVAVYAPHAGELGLRLDCSYVRAELTAHGGAGRLEAEAFGFDTLSVGGGLAVGAGVDVGDIRYAAVARVMGESVTQTYDIDLESTTGALLVAGDLAVAWQFHRVMGLEVMAGLGGRFAAGPALFDPYDWRLAWTVSAALTARVL